MALKAEVEELEVNRVLLKVEVDSEEVNRAIDQAFRTLAREVFVPGFRKGKVPRRVLQARIGMEPIYEQVVENHLLDFYTRAVEQAGIDPVSEPEIEDVNIEEGKPLTFTAKVEVKPVIQLGDYRGIEVAAPDRSVTEEEVKRHLDRLRERFARLESVPGKRLEKGDFALIDFNGTVNNLPLEGGSAQDFMYELGTGMLWPEFDRELEGKRVGDILDIKVKIPEEFEDEKVAGDIASFKVIVKEVKVKKLPEANDDFAREASAFDTLEELENDIRGKLEKIKEAEAEKQIANEVLNKLVGQLEVELPPGMVNRYVNRRKERLELGLKDVGLTLDRYLEAIGYTAEKMEDELTEGAIKSIKAELILDEVARRENLQVGEEELEQEMAERARASGVTPEKFREMLEEKGAIEYLRQELLLEKALKFLRDSAVLITGDEGAPEAAAIEPGTLEAATEELAETEGEEEEKDESSTQE